MRRVLVATLLLAACTATDKQDEEHRAMQDEVRQAYEASVMEYEQKYLGARPPLNQKDLADKMPE